MKLESIYIKNFRNINEVNLDFSNFTVLIGENNIGKTNILMALQKILKLDESPYRVSFVEEDFYLDNSAKRTDEIIIEIRFNKLDENDKKVFLPKGIDLDNDQIAIRLEAKWEEANNDASIEIFYHRLDDPINPKGPLFRYSDKKYIPFYYINAYRDIWKETQYSSGDLRQIFKQYNKQYLKPLNIQIKKCLELIDLFLALNGKKDEELLSTLSNIKKSLNSISLDDIDQNYQTLMQSEKIKDNSNLQKILVTLGNIVKKNSIQNKIIELQASINSIEEIKKIKKILNDNLSLFVPIENFKIELSKLDEKELFDETKIYLEDIPILRHGSGFQNSFVMAIKISKFVIFSSDEYISANNLLIFIKNSILANGRQYVYWGSLNMNSERIPVTPVA